MTEKTLLNSKLKELVKMMMIKIHSQRKTGFEKNARKLTECLNFIEVIVIKQTTIYEI